MHWYLALDAAAESRLCLRHLCLLNMNSHFQLNHLLHQTEFIEHCRSVFDEWAALKHQEEVANRVRRSGGPADRLTGHSPIGGDGGGGSDDGIGGGGSARPEARRSEARREGAKALAGDTT